MTHIEHAKGLFETDGRWSLHAKKSEIRNRKFSLVIMCLQKERDLSRIQISNNCDCNERSLFADHSKAQNNFFLND